MLEGQYKTLEISTAATTVIAARPGTLIEITVEGGTAGTITGYDNASAASGTKIFDFDSTNALQTYKFDSEFFNGLTIVTSQATKVTVSYR